MWGNLSLAKKRFKFRYAIIILLLAVGISLGWHYFNGNLGSEFNNNTNSLLNDGVSVHYIDVGQGDCELILDHGKTVLIDAGEVDRGSVVVKYLKSLGIKKIDLFIGTHPHTDHIGGFLNVAKSFDIDRIIIPEIPENMIPTTSTYRNFLQLIKDKKISVDRGEMNKSYKIGEGIINILGPIGKDYAELNDWSVGARYTYKERSFLFCGDMEKEAEKDLLNSNQLIKSDVFKLSHHGSKTSNTKKLLDAIGAKMFVIEVGKDNMYKHPSIEVMKRLKDAKVYRTDCDGTIVISTDGKDFDIKSQKRKGVEHVHFS